MGLVVYGLWFTIHALWFMIYGLWFMVYGLWFMVYGLWFRVQGLVLSFECLVVHPSQRPLAERIYFRRKICRSRRVTILSPGPEF